MAPNKLLILLILCGFGYVLPVSAQFDPESFGRNLQEQFGPPLPRRVFTVPPGFEMTVDFAGNGHVCAIDLPPVAPSIDPALSGVKTGKAVDDFVTMLVPFTTRGKEIRRLYTASGRLSVSIVEYENVTVSEAMADQRRTGVRISFPAETCQSAAEHYE